MKDRIRLIRQNTELTQKEFANRIGVSRNTIATYETSDRIPMDAVIFSICREFHVNEHWLRTGEGAVYVEINPDLALSQWFGQILHEENLSFKKQLLMKFSKMSDSDWEMLEHLFHLLAPDKNIH